MLRHLCNTPAGQTGMPPEVLNRGIPSHKKVERLGIAPKRRTDKRLDISYRVRFNVSVIAYM